MALTLLPEEVVEEIAEYLDVKDLLNCSAVNLDWRETFNADVLWKRFCTKEIKSYLEEFPCQVQPVFKTPQQKDSRLHALCSWRIHYMRKIHLLNNWKAGRYSSFQIRSYVDIISSDVKIDDEGTHWLFIRTESSVEVWNIQTLPCLHATYSIFLECPNVNIFVCGKRAVITQWNIVTVYDLQDKNEMSSSLFRFLLEDGKPLPLISSNTTDKTDIDFLNEDDDFRFISFGNLLAGYKRIPNPQSDLSMHLWNISTGEKLKTVSMLNSPCEDNEIAFSNIFKIDEIKGLIRLVFRSPDNIMCSQIYSYDFKKQKFTTTDIVFPGVVVWCGCAYNIIVTFSSHPGGTIKFYNYLTGRLLSVKEIGEYTNSEQLQLVDSYFMYCMFNCMNVIDIHKQEVIYCLQFSFFSFVRRLTVIEPRFVVVWLLEHGGSPGCPSYYQEVWDMKDLSAKLFQCSSEVGFEMLTNSSSVIKQVIAYDGMVCLYTFW